MSLRTTRMEVPDLPRGWYREEVPRNNSSHLSVSSAGVGGRGNSKSDVYYISPFGARIRSKPELVKHLGERMDLSLFDYNTGKLLSNNRNNVGGNANNGGAASITSVKKGNAKGFDISRNLRSDTSLVPPIRQTASIFKQPVTVHKHDKENSKVKNDASSASSKSSSSSSSTDKPRQLFWEKRLSGLRASYPDEIYEPFTLPENFKPVGPNVKEDVVLASIATVLHTGTGSINGQLNATVKNVDKNPAIYINPEQPLIAGVTISDADLEKQQERVDAARKELEEALNALHE